MYGLKLNARVRPAVVDEGSAHRSPRGPSRKLQGQAATEPAGQFCAAAPVSNLAAVDTKNLLIYSSLLRNWI